LQNYYFTKFVTSNLTLQLNWTGVPSEILGKLIIFLSTSVPLPEKTILWVFLS